jgi:hypothetical protein
MGISKLEKLVIQTLKESVNNPPVKVMVSTIDRGTKILMWKMENFDKEVGSDAYVSTTTPFKQLVTMLNTDPSNLITTDREAVEVLKLLTQDEISELLSKNPVTTTNIPPSILDKYKTSRNDTQDLSENSHMNKQEKLVRMIKQMIAEEFKGSPDDAAEVESDELTAHLSEDSVADDIKDLEALLANPDPTRAKDYGTIDNYKKMLRQKIARLKGEEPGMGPEYRVRSDEPEPFGYGMDESKISVSEFTNIIYESIREVMDEKKIVESIKIQSLEDFYQDEMDDVVAESLLDVREEVDLDKYRDMLGSTFRELSDEELMAYLRRQYLKRQATTDKDLKKQLAKDPEFQRQIKIDKYKYPYIHASTAVKIVDASGKEFNLEQLKNTIKERPTKILKQNEKIQHSGGGVSIYYNIGLPALKGLAVNEKTNKLVVIDTCPGAGACKVYCYAKKGGYIQYENAPISATRMLNFLVNDPSGFKSMLEREIAAAVKSAGKKNAKVVVRWHDAGDMFSADYLNLAYDVARKFPNVDFYAYTKMASVAQGEKPSNFLINFSAGATKPQERDVDFSKTKHSTVVPKQMFDDLITKDAKGVAVRDDQDRIQFTPDNLNRLKQKLAAKYNVPASSILSYEEMLATPVSNEVGKYNVIVRPGDGDESANRKDVKGTYLLIH